MHTTSPLHLLPLGFIAGFAATLIFHQGAWFLLNQASVIPADRPAWPLDAIPPFGLPSVISKALWGGLWGAVLALVLARLDGTTYWIGWTVVGALALTLVAFFVVPLIKAQPIPALWPRFGIGCLVNGAWGVGTALFLRLMGVGGQ